MNLKQRLAELLAEVDTLSKKKSADLTNEELARVGPLRDEIIDVEAKIKAQDDAAKALKDAMSGHQGGEAAKASPSGSRGDRVAGFAAAFKAQVPAQLATKAMVPNQQVTIEYDAPLVVEPRPALTMLALIGAPGQAENPTGAYLRSTLRENNAATVAAGGKKPTSRFAMESIPWEVATVAHLSEPIRRQWLQDFGVLENWISIEMAYGLTEALQDLMLDGGTTESGATVKGLNDLEGVNVQPFATNAFRTLRLAIAELENKGLTPTGIALHPNDWTEMELATDNDDRPLTTALLGQALGRSLWGVPVIVSTQVEEGHAWVADWSTIEFELRGAYELTWTDKGVVEIPPVAPATEPTLQDLYEHNLLRARSEVRAVFKFLQPAAITKATILPSE